MEEGSAIKWLWSGGQESYNDGEPLSCTLPQFFTFHYEMRIPSFIPSLEVQGDTQLYHLSPSLLFMLCKGLFTKQQGKKGGLNRQCATSPLVFWRWGGKHCCWLVASCLKGRPGGLGRGVHFQCIPYLQLPHVS